jgi:hypothetical protein
MQMSPIITKALIDSRQHDRLAEARQARLAKQAELANRAARETAAAARPASGRRWRFRLAALLRVS